MPKRRASGEGNIRKRKDGRWEGRYTVGHVLETGKAIEVRAWARKKQQVSYWRKKCGKSPDFARNQDFLSCITNLDAC